MKIFISYAREDKPQVLALIQALGVHETWFDDKLNLGQEWWREIEHQIAASHCFMFLISPDSLKSEYCRKEYEFARKLGKPVAPVLVRPATLPDEMSKLQLISLIDGLTPETIVRLLNGLFEIERRVFNPFSPPDSEHAPLLSVADLTFVTTNEAKRTTYEQILGMKLQMAPIRLDDLQHLDAGEVVLHKAEAAYRALNKPVIVEQTALAIRAWGGLPGGLTPCFFAPIGAANLCKMVQVFDDRYAEAVAAIGFSDGTILRKFCGVLPGAIADAPSGVGSSWDTVFIPQDFNKTLAAMTEEERLSISMRRRAVVDFMQFLQSNYHIR
jgi:non-canonical purine NTP pyrophosphatase (RdgB/HAM1 family)